MLTKERRTFNGWLGYLDPYQKHFRERMFQMKNWSYEWFDKDNLTIKLKCNLCNNWCDNCKCFEKC